jgi:thiol-disulfide isomerase/thioredoxin
MPDPDRRRHLTWFLIVLALVVAWSVFLIVFGPRPGGVALGTPRLGMASPPRPADFSWALRDLDDRPVDFARFRGRAIFLNIWATWCPPCVAELPSIASLADDPRLKDVAFVCVSTDDSAEAVRRFLQGKNWSMTILRATDLPASFATDAIPATFLIAPDGTIVVSEVGGAQWDDPKVVDLLERLARGKPSAAPEAP